MASSFGRDISFLLLLLAMAASGKQSSSLAKQATLTLSMQASRSSATASDCMPTAISEQAEIIQPESFYTFWFKPITNSSMAQKQATQTAGGDLTSNRFELLLRLFSPTISTAITCSFKSITVQTARKLSRFLIPTDDCSLGPSTTNQTDDCSLSPSLFIQTDDCSLSPSLFSSQFQREASNCSSSSWTNKKPSSAPQHINLPSLSIAVASPIASISSIDLQLPSIVAIRIDLPLLLPSILTRPNTTVVACRFTATASGDLTAPSATVAGPPQRPTATALVGLTLHLDLPLQSIATEAIVNLPMRSTTTVAPFATTTLDDPTSPSSPTTATTEAPTVPDLLLPLTSTIALVNLPLRSTATEASQSLPISGAIALACAIPTTHNDPTATAIETFVDLPLRSTATTEAAPPSSTLADLPLQSIATEAITLNDPTSPSLPTTTVAIAVTALAGEATVDLPHRPTNLAVAYLLIMMSGLQAPFSGCCMRSFQGDPIKNHQAMAPIEETSHIGGTAKGATPSGGAPANGPSAVAKHGVYDATNLKTIGVSCWLLLSFITTSTTEASPQRHLVGPTAATVAGPPRHSAAISTTLVNLTLHLDLPLQ
jgi:hypothetical protein